MENVTAAAVPAEKVIISSPIADKIIAKFPELKDVVRVQRAQRIWVKVPQKDFRKFLEFAAKDLKVNVFCMLTGLDDKENFSLIYHMADLSGLVLNIETSVPKTNAKTYTITDMYPAADLQEREVMNLFGVEISGLEPSKNRYPLPDDWPAGEYPMRKEWTQDKLDKKDSIVKSADASKEDQNG